MDREQVAAILAKIGTLLELQGENKFLMFLHDYQVTDLRTSTSSGQWLDIQKAALAGGASSKSPIYTGCLSTRQSRRVRYLSQLRDEPKS